MEIEELKENIRPLLENSGYDLVSLNWYKTKSEKRLEIVVDREDPISLNDLEALSGKISDLLDLLDPSEESYLLDLSSLGAEKPIPLDKLPATRGYVHLHLSHPYEGKNDLEGELGEMEGENLVLITFEKGRKKKALIPVNTVDKARRAVKF